MRYMNIMAIITILASLVGCKKYNPQILDGPGMVYVDSQYRSIYANCLPFEDTKGAPYLAIAYLGKADKGKANKDVYIKNIFDSLTEEEINRINVYEYEGDEWFLVIPKYKSVIDLKKDSAIIGQGSYTGEAFVIKCNQDIVVSTFETEEINYPLRVDENGKLKETGENVWDITNLDEVLIK